MGDNCSQGMVVHKRILHKLRIYFNVTRQEKGERSMRILISHQQLTTLEILIKNSDINNTSG